MSAGESSHAYGEMLLRHNNAHLHLCHQHALISAQNSRRVLTRQSEDTLNANRAKGVDNLQSDKDFISK